MTAEAPAPTIPAITPKFRHQYWVTSSEDKDARTSKGSAQVWTEFHAGKPTLSRLQKLLKTHRGSSTGAADLLPILTAQTEGN